MAVPAYAEASVTFGRYALRFVRKLLSPVSAEGVAELSGMIVDIDKFLADVDLQTESMSPDLLPLIEDIRALRSRIALFLAVAGLNASWGDGAKPIVLDHEDSAFVIDMLQNPPEPNDALREAAKDYKSFIGL